MALFVFAIIILFFIWLYKLLSPSSRLKRMGDKIPGPKPWPLLGNSLMMLKKDHFLRITEDISETYGPVSRIWLGKELLVLLSDSADIETFLTSKKYLDKSDSYRLLDSWLGDKNLLTSDMKFWKSHRKILTPSFHFKILESSLRGMQKNANTLCDQLECRVNQEEFDILQYIERCSLDIICETAMGVQFEIQKSKNSNYLQSVKKLEKITVDRIFQPWLQPDILFKFTSSGKTYYPACRVIKEEVVKVINYKRFVKVIYRVAQMIVKRVTSPWLYNSYIFGLSSLGQAYFKELQTVKKTVYQVIRERKQNLEIRRSNVDNKRDGRRQAKPFLDCMLLESNFTDEEIEDEVQTFMFAGHDTTMTTMAFCVYALSRHSDVQEKLYQEIKNVLGDDKQELSYQEYNELKYLDNVLKETLRMYTTVPIISRKVPEDVLLPSGYILPAGSMANFMLKHMHNNEKYFSNPRQFIPERFENKEELINFSFVPFSAGPRNCIGQKFAMLEMKIVISKLVQKYRFLPSEKVQTLTLETSLVLRSLEKHPLRITLRNV